MQYHLYPHYILVIWAPIRFWIRNVDDTFCFLQKSAVEVLQHLNTILPTINFIVEQKDGQLYLFWMP